MIGRKGQDAMTNQKEDKKETASEEDGPTTQIQYITFVYIKST